MSAEQIVEVREKSANLILGAQLMEDPKKEDLKRKTGEVAGLIADIVSKKKREEEEKWTDKEQEFKTSLKYIEEANPHVRALDLIAIREDMENIGIPNEFVHAAFMEMANKSVDKLMAEGKLKYKVYFGRKEELPEVTPKKAGPVFKGSTLSLKDEIKRRTQV